MGTTLASFHVYQKSPEAIRPLLDEGYTAVVLSEGWTSVLSRVDECELSDKPAKKLSKALDSPVLSFMYFDDDLMTLTLFNGGKLCAQYRMSYDAEPYLGHCDAFVETLGWDKALSGRLRRIFKCSDLEEQVEMLEEFFGVALRVDAEFIEDGHEDFVRKRGEALYREYEAKQKKLSKIKNKTRAVLTQELDAKLSCADPCIATYRGNTNMYEHDMGEALELVGDELKPLMGSFRMSGFSAKIYPGREWYTLTNEFGLVGKHGYTCLRVTTEGKVLGEVPIPQGVHVAAVLDNGDIIGITWYNPKKEEPVHVLRLNGKGEVLWRVPFEGGAISIGPVLHGGYIYFGGSIIASEKDGVLIKLSEDGHILATLHTPYLHHYAGLWFDRGWVYYLGGCYDNGWNSALLKLNGSLQIEDILELSKGMFASSISEFDRRNARLHFSAMNKRLVSIDLAAWRYAVVTVDDEIFPQLSDNGYIYGTTTGFSTLCVLDADMRLVSRHRLKGIISQICRSETGVHAITSTDYTGWGVPEPHCYTRVYRIEPV